MKNKLHLIIIYTINIQNGTVKSKPHDHDLNFTYEGCMHTWIASKNGHPILSRTVLEIEVEEFFDSLLMDDNYACHNFIAVK